MFTAESIGVVYSPFSEAQGTPIQPFAAGAATGIVEIFEPFAEGLQDLEGFDRIWILYWCHRACAPKLTIVPYRDTMPHGVFATRAGAAQSHRHVQRVFVGHPRAVSAGFSTRHPPRHARARREAIRAAVRQLFEPAMRLAGPRRSAKWDSHRRRPLRVCEDRTSGSHFLTRLCAPAGRLSTLSAAVRSMPSSPCAERRSSALGRLT